MYTNQKYYSTLTVVANLWIILNDHIIKPFKKNVLMHHAILIQHSAFITTTFATVAKIVNRNQANLSISFCNIDVWDRKIIILCHGLYSKPATTINAFSATFGSPLKGKKEKAVAKKTMGCSVHWYNNFYHYRHRFHYIFLFSLILWQ